MAYMNGIDISNWQAGIDLSKVPCDFVICKATEGAYFVSPDCARQVEQALSLGKATGIYHYANGGDPIAEANFFVDNCKNWIGKVVWCLDWEGQGNSLFGSGASSQNWIRRFCDQVYARTKSQPLVYTSAAYLNEVQNIGNRGLWIAQYANMNATGYQDSPWNEGAYACAIRQYSSAGRLAGYNGNLDLDKFYGDRAAWDKYVRGDGAVAPSAPSTPAKKSIDELAKEVIAGQWGNDPERTQKLNAAGYDASTVQKKVNELLGVSSSTIRYTVQPNDNLSIIAAKYGVSINAISGYRSGNPNVIYPGEILTIRK